MTEIGKQLKISMFGQRLNISSWIWTLLLRWLMYAENFRSGQRGKEGPPLAWAKIWLNFHHWVFTAGCKFVLMSLKTNQKLFQWISKGYKNNKTLATNGAGVTGPWCSTRVLGCHCCCWCRSPSPPAPPSSPSWQGCTQSLAPAWTWGRGC